MYSVTQTDCWASYLVQSYNRNGVHHIKHGTKEVARGTLNSIRKMSGLDF